MSPRISLGTLLGRENEILGTVSIEIRARFLTFTMKDYSTFSHRFKFSIVALIYPALEGLSGKQNCIQSKCPRIRG